MLIVDLIMTLDLMVVFLTMVVYITSVKPFRVQINILLLVFKDQHLRIKFFMLSSKYMLEEEVEVGILVEVVVEIPSQLVRFVKLMFNTQQFVPSQFHRSQQAINQPFEVQSQNSILPLPASHIPTPRSQAYSNSSNHPSPVASSGYNKDFLAYSQPSNSQIQGHLVYTNDAYQNSGGYNTISPVVTISEKFAGACQVATPMTLADSS
ncbi:hypothetical protein FEM48_Zijuj05G0091600 [Ziziphus jujuba var. spinosa]|uniref:Uncharacterized protein n=1 Tax=Ziziphus jujuba var. spinosa TaxID=714518 RepID=A0A978VE32_ZIZJJ|nr:hypothetical protein FEM48_Zijuj05G0091600 [Ziziphus jujuba var. spinosa]